MPHNTVELTACSMPVLRKKGYYAFLADGADAVAEKNRNIDINADPIRIQIRDYLQQGWKYQYPLVFGILSFAVLGAEALLSAIYLK